MKERKIFCLNEISRTGTDIFRQVISLVIKELRYERT